MTQKPGGTERVVLLDTFRCIVCLYIKVLLEFLWIMRPRLLIIAPAIRLQERGGGGGGYHSRITLKKYFHKITHRRAEDFFFLPITRLYP